MDSSETARRVQVSKASRLSLLGQIEDQLRLDQVQPDHADDLLSGQGDAGRQRPVQVDRESVLRVEESAHPRVTGLVFDLHGPVPMQDWNLQKSTYANSAYVSHPIMSDKRQIVRLMTTCSVKMFHTPSGCGKAVSSSTLSLGILGVYAVYRPTQSLKGSATMPHSAHHSDAEIQAWVLEFRTGVFRSLTLYRRLALAGPITQEDDLIGLVDLCNLIEEVMQDVEFLPDMPTS